LGAILSAVATDLVTEHRFVELEASEPPWLDTGLHVEAGDLVTVVLAGRVFFDQAADLWLDPSVQVWTRVGGHGPIERGSRATNTFRCANSGTVELGNAAPAEWVDRDGRITTDPGLYAFMTGGTTVGLIRWAHGVDPAGALRDLAAAGDVENLLMAEADRLDSAGGSPPPGWEHLWYLGPSEVYVDSDGVITCSSDNDFAIICHGADMALRPDTTLSWEWRVDQLPSAVAEDSFATHDYLSIAVEFDDGRDLTYCWSASLEPGTAFRCPLPHWSERETHLVVRSGTSDLGRWLREERNVHADRARAIGGPDPARITGVWIIAVSCFQHLGGRCAYRSICLADGLSAAAIN